MSLTSVCLQFQGAVKKTPVFIQLPVRSPPQVAFGIKGMDSAFPGGVESLLNCWRRLKMGCGVFLLLEALPSAAGYPSAVLGSPPAHLLHVPGGRPALRPNAGRGPQPIRRLSPAKTRWERRSKTRTRVSKLKCHINTAFPAKPSGRFVLFTHVSSCHETRGHKDRAPPCKRDVCTPRQNEISLFFCC